MDTTAIVIAVIALLGGNATGAFVLHFFARRKIDVEADSIIVATAERIVGMQQDTVERSGRERMELESKLSAQTERLDNALVRIEDLSLQMMALRIEQAEERAHCAVQITSLRSQIETLQFHRRNPEQFPEEHTLQKEG
jgi:hypothetical protein